MIGEIRDAETAKVAVQAALTGHLVLSTLHTNDSAGRRHADGRHGSRAVQACGRRGGRRRATAGEDDLPRTAERTHYATGGVAAGDALQGRPESQVLARRRVPAAATTQASAAARACTKCLPADSEPAPPDRPGRDERGGPHANRTRSRGCPRYSDGGLDLADPRGDQPRGSRARHACSNDRPKRFGTNGCKQMPSSDGLLPRDRRRRRRRQPSTAAGSPDRRGSRRRSACSLTSQLAMMVNAGVSLVVGP